ncbi:MAG: hypothetical protein M1839_007474 [Geoglossum umbratile]|nr:MAG: hypothetical protein M1839_007474 [Geoglossum umbratile]
MSSKRFSPTASLLRTSRLFSLPPPLPRPLPELTPSGTNHSNTATLPFPVYSAISAPQSSLSRGDWGLKRQLPLKSTINSSTPTIRIGAIDTWEHITEFESAADHVSTVRKWQEMHIPMSVPDGRRPTASTVNTMGWALDGPHRSVFESKLDSTLPNPGDPATDARRWKFGGPWLAGKTEGEFNRYLDREIRRRKMEFRQYIRKHVVAKKRRISVENGQVPEATEHATAEDEVSEDELQDYIISLRADKAKLNALIHKFLDLPAPPIVGLPSSSNHGFGMNPGSVKSIYAETGPPKTHPSAGLSYLRTSSHIQNHPLLGPQANPTPVQARILVPRKSATSSSNLAKLGVAGVVCHDSVAASFRQDKLPDGTPGITRLDVHMPGGAKLWVHPSRASVGVGGRIKLETVRANKTVLAIHEGSIFEEREDTEPSSPSLRRLPSLTPTTHAHRGYGIEGLKRSRTENDTEYTQIQKLDQLLSSRT